MNRRNLLKLCGYGLLMCGAIGLRAFLFKREKQKNLESKLEMKITQEKSEFEELYKIITGEEKPDNVRLSALTLEDYVRTYQELHGKEPSLMELEKNVYTGNIEFTAGGLGGHKIIVLQNREDFLTEAISHGIGHVKFASEYYKLNPDGEINKDTDKVVRETAAHIAVQRALTRSTQKEYIKTRYYYHTSWFGDSTDRPGAEYARELIQKYGVDKAWNIILDIKNKEELEDRIKASLLRRFSSYVGKTLENK